MFEDIAKRLTQSKPKTDYKDKIRLIQGDILDQKDIDVMVTFLTADLSMGGPLNQAVLEKAGKKLQQFIESDLKRPKAGTVHMAPATGLPFKKVIFAVLPPWSGGFEGEDRNILRCYRRAVELMQNDGYASIAFPALGMARLNFPHIRYARLALQGINEILDYRAGEVRIVCKEADMMSIYEERLRKL